MKFNQLHPAYRKVLLHARHHASLLGSALVALVVISVVHTAAFAQQPYPRPNAGPPPNYNQAYPRADQRPRSRKSLRCAQLEHELANSWVNRSQLGNDKRAIQAEIRKYDRIYQRAQSQAERSGCYRSNFIFGRSLVRTPKCLRLSRQIEDARRQLESLNAQRDARRGGSNRRRDELIAALARAGCGNHYQRRASRDEGLFSWLEEGFWDTAPRRGLETSRIEQFATYRTLCVRQCDGYYFPVSFSTLPSNFGSDIQQCQSQCAAPAELYVYRNPGEEPEQMVSSDGQRAYANLPNAWRYRKEFIKGCSCKQAEYDPAEIAAAEAKAEADALAKERGEKPAGDGSQFAGDKDKARQTQ